MKRLGVMSWATIIVLLAVWRLSMTGLWLWAEKAIGWTQLDAIKMCESGGDYESVNGDDWHVRWPHSRGHSHYRSGSFGAYQFGWGRWYSAAHEFGFGEWAEVRPDDVPPSVQDAVALRQWMDDSSVWSCSKLI